jgi:hypothetical protein
MSRKTDVHLPRGIGAPATRALTAAGYSLLAQLDGVPADGSACREFWGEVLGMNELEKPPALPARGGWFRGGFLEVHLGVEEPFIPARKCPWP